MDTRSKTFREIIVFLVLTVVFSTLAYILIIKAGTTDGPQSKLAGLLMLAPGLAAILTCLVFEHSLRSIGWGPGKIKYLILGLSIPLIYCLIGYGFVWLTGHGKYNGQFPPRFLIFLVTMLVMGTLSALLEEAAWRGFPGLFHSFHGRDKLCHRMAKIEIRQCVDRRPAARES